MTRIVPSILLTLTCGMVMADEPFEKLSIQYTGGPYKNETFNYRLMSPAKIEPGKTYPLVLFLHGAGERGEDNELQLTYLPESMATAENRKRFPCFLLAPQCRKDAKWVNVPWGQSKSQPMAKEPTDQMKAVIAMLERTLKEKPVDKSRVYLTGLSMGGYGSWELAARFPDRFAAALVVCGGGDEKQAHKLANIPIWVFHGDADTAVPVSRSREMVQAIHDIGGKKIKYSELPGVKHNSWLNAYSQDAGAIKWMFEQRQESK